MMRGGPDSMMRPPQQESMMRGGPDSMIGGGRDSMMRSMSVSNGGGNNYGGNGSTMGGGGDGGFNRSMSYHGNSSSPPLSGGGDSGLKIGTWNEPRQEGSGQGMGGGTGQFPAVSNFEIGTFNMTDPGSRQNGYGNGNNGSSGPTTQSNNGPIQPGMGIRETGIIEKLLHSYGFIQCCDRQARLFFHFSQFDGNIEHLKIGDPVEFEMTYDRRTGKPIASAVSKIAPEVVMSEERVIGTVTTEVKVMPDGSESQGRISYENRGECFFLPFNIADVEGNVTLAAGEKVSFQMATVQRSGNLAAKTIRLENPAAPVKYQGVVNSLKDTFGFIERADVVKEIIFHTSDVVEGREEDNSHILLADDVEFNIQTRNGKEVACNLTKLSAGTVVFEDVGLDYFTGQVLKPLDRTGKYQQTDPLPGRVKYRAMDRSEAEIPFGEKDQVGDFTLRHGDWIKFVVAIDRRDKLKRATKIELLDESFKVSDERREQGVVQALKEGFGFLRCVDRTEKMFFHFSECLDVNRKLLSGDEVEFTVAPDPANMGRQLATRIKHLAPGSVKFDIVIAQNILGLLTEEPSSASWPRSPSKAGESPSRAEGAGKIVYELNGLQLAIPLYATDCDLRATPKVNDKVQFNINQLKATKETNAVSIRILERAVAAPLGVQGQEEPGSPPREKKESQGRLGTPVTFLLAVAANFRLEARQLQVVAGKKEHTRVRAKSVMSCSSESEDMVAVKQVTSEEFSGELITKIGAMDLAALKTLFDRQLRQRLVALVQQPVGSRVVIAVILRSVILEGCRVQDNISRMVMTNFLDCCSTKQGCAVVQTCLEKFSPDNKLLVAEQLLELDSVEQFTELWLYGGQVFSLCLDLLDSPSLAAVAFSLVGHYSSLASSVRHYRPLRSLLTRIAATDCFPEILPELEQELVSLACSRFGHTVVASLLEAVPPALCHRLVGPFQGRVAELSCHPVCSAVMVVAVGVAAAGQQAELIEEVCTVTSSQADMAVIGLARDRHGHRVVLAMLQVSQHRQEIGRAHV